MYNSIKLNIDKEVTSYLLGFLFSIILTVLSFFIATEKIFSSEVNYLIILILAIIQIVIHFFYFLHLNCSSEGIWNIITLLFVIMIIFIVLFGSVWIMSNLNHHVLLNC
ncbi:MAG: cytochrome o ubiquinol oxidase subunit IV [Buchnera aphidicola (Brevicoryne brassicae)]|uniref:Cytochrome bo(3) ubiquinol oxidase subunit 4 n=1 Tax=Buchnera aphidicola (Brevicoryne brassicae) TaxID=911343 RepID=A0AAJ5PUK4_9GAMM|nr:cytochrome o ubiquinol oxidase subunit IV [Buchnera aphidicola]QCI20016.1 cytochrome o ubiquinol oxidase subunit IV [Buchnera aphidicola (Brevicoryne brassicae)]WAI18840.1 MAG: cytochrome o ubiquinol oxidase subunit IV [Buchnera aphidicola (Brevicoryne brassicae)]